MSKITNDSLGDRMKEYEASYARKLLRRMYTIIRIDGQSFHTYTQGLKKPFDKGLVDDMIATASYLCGQIQGVKLAYVQSDEISLVLTDFDTRNTQPWFGSELQKMVSISASMATAKFNQLRMTRAFMDGLDVIDIPKVKQATFDSRVYQLPDFVEVGNYLIWRQQDCVRNSISGTAQALYSHTQLHNQDSSAKQELIFQRGNHLMEKLVACGYGIGYNDQFNKFVRKDNFNWNDLPPHLKRGTTITKQLMEKHYPTETYEKDKRSAEVKLSKGGGWFLKMSTPGEFDYYKVVNTWTPLPVDYSTGAFEWLAPVLKQVIEA